MKSQLLSQIYSHPMIRHEELERLIEAHARVTYKKGDYILEHGQTADSYLIIEKGLMRAFVHDTGGNDITTDFFCESEVAIEVLSLFNRIPTPENIQALTDCECWKIDFNVFQELFHSIGGFPEWGRLWMTNSLFRFKQRFLGMVTTSAKERYLQLIKEKPQVILQAPLRNIASYLGITETSFSRIRKEI